jgi:hypothetical protein
MREENGRGEGTNPRGRGGDGLRREGMEEGSAERGGRR